MCKELIVTDLRYASLISLQFANICDTRIVILIDIIGIFVPVLRSVDLSVRLLSDRGFPLLPSVSTARETLGEEVLPRTRESMGEGSQQASRSYF